MQPRTLGDLNALRVGKDMEDAIVKHACRRALADGDSLHAIAMSEGDPQMRPHLEPLRKAALDALSTQPGSPLGPLAAEKPYGAAFLRHVALRSVLDRLVGRVDAPPNIWIGQQETSALVQWVGESSAAPADSLQVSAAPMTPLKMATLVPVSRELARFSAPNAVELVENALASAVADFTNQSAFDPSFSAIDKVRPASLTHGVVPVTPSGNLEEDVALVLAGLSEGNPSNPYVIMSPRSALYLATRRSGSGDRLFPDLTFLGGSILGVPVLIATAGMGDRIVGVDAGGIAVVDLGLELGEAQNVAVQMDSAPTNSSGGVGSPSAPVPTTLVSLWQSNAVGVKAVRFLNWAKRHDAVAYLELAGSPLP